MEAKIEGEIKHIRSLSDAHEKYDEGWGILRIDARNAFNEGNTRILSWVARHKWPSGSLFGFNIRRYHAVLVMRGESKKKPVFCIVEKERYRIVRL